MARRDHLFVNTARWCNGSTQVSGTWSLGSNPSWATMKTICVSGGFDPIHVGHLRMFQEARELGDRLVVIVNNDNWLNVKKGYNFMSQEDRKEIILGFSCVDEVALTNHSQNTTDMSVCEELRLIKPDVFANGGDRKADNIPEYRLCEELGIEMVFNIGGDKIRSSSELVSKGKNHG